MNKFAKAQGLAFAAILTASFPAHANELPGFDVRGMKLGMTPAEVHASIRAEGLPATQRPNTIPLDQHDFYMDEIRINRRDELSFVSSIVSRPRLTDGSRRIRETVVATFTPAPSTTQAWGIGYRRDYLPQDMPQIRSVLDRLASKYGQSSWTQGFDRATFRQGVNSTSHHGGIMLWYWDKSGRQLGPAIHETCRMALHNSYITLGRGGSDPRGRNAAMSRGTLFTGATEAGLRAGCSKVIRVMLQWTPEGLVRSISVEAMDVDLARTTSDRMMLRLTEIERQASQGRVNAATRNKPDF